MASLQNLTNLYQNILWFAGDFLWLVTLTGVGHCGYTIGYSGLLLCRVREVGRGEGRGKRRKKNESDREEREIIERENERDEIDRRGEG